MRNEIVAVEYQPEQTPDSDKRKAALTCAAVAESREELVTLLRMLGLPTEGLPTGSEVSG